MDWPSDVTLLTKCPLPTAVYTSVEPLRDAVSDDDAPFMGCAQPFASADAISIVPRIVLTDRVDIVAI